MKFNWLLLALLISAPALAEEASVKEPAVVEAATPATQPQATLELEWEVVEDAVAYEVKLVPKAGGETILLKTQEPRISQRVPVGTYDVSIRSQDKANGYFGQWGDASEIEVTSKVVELKFPPNESILKEPKDKRLNVEFKWNGVADAKLYTLKLWSEDQSEPLEFKANTTSKALKLLTGKVYFWQVTYESVKSVRYQAAPATFSFTILGHQLAPPIVDKRIQKEPILPVSWKASAGAERYEAKILRRYLDETEWMPLDEVKSTEALTWQKFKKLEPGAYRIEVVAHAKNKVSSEPGVFEFVVKPTEEELSTALQSAVNESAQRQPTEAASAKN